MMLEEHVILVCSSTDATEDVALHEFVDVRTKAVNNLGLVSFMEIVGTRLEVLRHSRRDHPKC